MSVEVPIQLFEKLKTMVGLSEEDVARLRDLGPIVAKHGPRITDQFYTTLGDTPETAKFLAGRVEHLKRTHGQWMQSLVTGPYDKSYLESRWRIGMAHVRVGLDPYWVECIMSVIRTAMGTAIGSEIANGPECAAKIASFTKVCDLDLMIINLSYGEDRLERLTAFTGMKRNLIENIIRIPKT